MAWDKAVITDIGAAMLSEVIEGKQLTITGAKGGNGTVAENLLKSAVGLKNEKQVLSVVDYTNVPNGKKINIQIDNDSLVLGYTMHQVGIFAKVDNGSEKMLAIIQDSTGIAVPSNSDISDFVLNFYVVLSVNNDSNVTVNVETSAYVSRGDYDSDKALMLGQLDLKASAAELNEHKNDKNNPHSVTKAQVGLGNVDNTSDLNKPVSTATQNALNNKVDKIAGFGLSQNDYSDSEKQKVAAIANKTEQFDFSATLGGFVGSEAPYVKELTISGILSTDKPFIDIIMSGNWVTDEKRIESWGSVYRAVASANKITFYATEKPEVDLPIQIKVIR